MLVKIHCDYLLLLTKMSSERIYLFPRLVMTLHHWFWFIPLVCGLGAFEFDLRLARSDSEWGRDNRVWVRFWVWTVLGVVCGQEL